MKTLKITSANFYNNAQAKLNINLSDGTTMCANVLDSDKKAYIAKEIELSDLVSKYFNFDGTKYNYLNPLEFNPDDFINFGSVSRLLANDRSVITRNRISPKHQKNVDALRKSITKWHESLSN